MTHLRPLLVALAATALLAAGCGSSGDDPGPAAAPATTAAKPKAAAPAAAEPAAPLSKAAYVRRADRLCREARGISRRANVLVQKAYAANQAVKAAQTVEQYTPIFSAKIGELKALPRPRRDRRVLDGLIKVMDAQVTALTATAKALRDENASALQQIGAEQQQELQFAEALGKRYGFRVCGRAA
jgi:hypothetical protein